VLQYIWDWHTLTASHLVLVKFLLIIVTLSNNELAGAEMSLLLTPPVMLHRSAVILECSLDDVYICPTEFACHISP
jgi:hypothetical protein